MNPWEVVGWAGQALFFSRFFVQWIVSERAGRSVAPRSFWWFSIGATVLFMLYSWGTDLPLFTAVFTVNLGVYARNIVLGGRAARALSPLVATLVALAAGALLWLGGELQPGKYELKSAEGLWLWIGSIGAVLWGGRFLLQWWFTERRGLSHFPLSFWWVSLVGNVAMLAYSLHIERTVLIVGFATGPFIQVRNLVLEYRRRERESAAPHDEHTLPAHEIAPHAPLARTSNSQLPPSRRR